MGLDTSHDAWHGSYSAFMRWRQMVAKLAGLPPLELMEGFWERGKYYDPIKQDAISVLDSLPISWAVLQPDPLHKLLFHSDCDGEIAAEDCAPIADRLEQLLPLMPNGEGGGHIGIWRDKTQQFIDGLRRAANANEPLIFH